MFDSYADIFAHRSRSYHGAMTRVPHARDAEFEAVIAPLERMPDGLLCDMPSGGCYLARYLPARIGYVAVEPVDEFLHSDGAKCGRVINAPITSVPLPDRSIDYVVSLAGLHHEASLPAVFNEMRRLVRPSGRVIIADVAIDTAPARFLNGFVAANNPLGHDGRFLDNATAGEIELAGFTVIDDVLLDVPWTFENFEQAAGFCRDLFGMAGVGQTAVREALEAELGFRSRGERQVELQWSLRRIICEPAR